MSGTLCAPDPTIRCGLSTHGETEQLKPYVLVRGRLEALVNRAVTYDLLALGEIGRNRWRSNVRHPFGRIGVPGHADGGWRPGFDR
jgi:hypothetical protein